MSELVIDQSLQVALAFRGSLLRKHSTKSHLWPKSHPGQQDYKLWDLFIRYITSSTFRLTTQITMQSTMEACIKSSLELYCDIFPHKSWFDTNIKIV